MIKHIILYFYCLPMWATFVYLILFLILTRYFLGCLERKDMGSKVVPMVCSIGVILWCAWVCYFTVISRQPEEVGVSYVPFHFLYEVMRGGNPEFIRSAWMNVLLFVPLGVCGYYARPVGKRNWRWILVVVIMGCFLSIGIEVMQGIFALGYMEVDDVICNTLGIYIGIKSSVIRISR